MFGPWAVWTDSVSGGNCGGVGYTTLISTPKRPYYQAVVASYSVVFIGAFGRIPGGTGKGAHRGVDSPARPLNADREMRDGTPGGFN